MRDTDVRSVDARPIHTASERVDPAVAAAERFVVAVAGVDYRGLFGSLAPAVRFRYLIPSGPGEIAGAADVAAKYFEWFGDVDVLEVVSSTVTRVADRVSARYRLLLREQAQWEVVEQQTFLDVDESGRIVVLDLLCSGFRPFDEREEGTMSRSHRFDAASLSCADGLAQEFRRRILAIPLGDVLEVATADPAAKEDLPPLARMMGHTVRTVEPSEDGRLLISVERGR
jgi:TusA-related sulfurtransferase